MQCYFDPPFLFYIVRRKGFIPLCNFVISCFASSRVETFITMYCTVLQYMYSTIAVDDKIQL